MCGISGSLTLSASGYSIENIRTQYNLMLASTMRGVDGTGVATGALSTDGDVTYDKGILAAPEFMSLGDLGDMIDRSRWVIAHTRAATLGGIKHEACHPFAHNGVVGVHNGTIYGIKTTFPKLEGINDSDIVYKALGEASPEDACDVLKELDPGAYALVWYDRRVNSLRFARNSDRPLWFYKAYDTWWWHSEPGALAMCLGRRDKALAYTDIIPWQLKTNALMTIPVDGEPAIIDEYEPEYAYSYPSSGYSSYNGYWRGSPSDYLDSWPTSGNYSYPAHKRGPVESSVGWLTITGTRDIWNSAQWASPIRTKIFAAFRKLFGHEASATVLDFNERLKELAEATGSTDKEPVIQFVAQAINDKTGMVYGAIDVANFGAMPIVGMMQKTELEIYVASRATATAGDWPVFVAKASNIKVYAEGTLGIGVVDVALLEWGSEDAISVTEKGIGSCKTHPHIIDSTYVKPVDWSAWD